MVTLEQFISETLVQIVRGATKAQKELGDTAQINPPTVSVKRGAIYNPTPGTMGQRPDTTTVKHEKDHVSFDVQVTASTESQTKGEAGVKLYVFSADTGGQSTTEHQHINRVQFSIPIVFDSQPPEAQ
jgi:hypothetical protein